MRLIAIVFSTLFYLFLTCEGVLASDGRTTNAERLARGLPLLRPRNFFDGSRIITAPHAKRSVVAISCPAGGPTTNVCCPPASLSGSPGAYACTAPNTVRTPSCDDGANTELCCTSLTNNGGGIFTYSGCAKVGGL
ncbi:hypothetical protein B0H11DRAFT_2288984 [Mycena galericulata]|nr:hypothetical protein B0H11DRAFT_2288984 [Mycena galericulata]